MKYTEIGKSPERTIFFFIIAQACALSPDNLP